MKHIAILGYGTVGSGAYQVLEESARFVEQKVGDAIEVKYVLDLRDFPDDPVAPKIVHDFEIIVNDPTISLVVETMGGIHPAYEYVKAALEAGKSAVTSNKQLVEAKGAELGALAAQHNVTFLFEASVGGGIPIVRTLNTAMWHEEVHAIWGILNGTTNFILDLMENTGVSFDEALRMAQEKGYAEKNPEADVDGYDSARKIAILGGLICNHHLSIQNIPTKGIREITVSDMAAARRLNGTIKLIASFEYHDDDPSVVYASVEPLFVPKGTPLYTVNNVYNAVLVHSKNLGNSMFYGRGAGKHATASAVVSDVMASLAGVSKKEMHMWDSEEMPILDAGLKPCRYVIVFANGSVFMSELSTREEIENLKAEFESKGIEYHIYRVLPERTEETD